MPGTASNTEKFCAAFGKISPNIVADKKAQVAKVLDDLDDALKDLADSTQKIHKAYHPGAKGVAEDYKPMRERFDAVGGSGDDDKKKFAAYEAIEKQAQAALKAVPAMKIAVTEQAKIKGKSKTEIDQYISAIGDKAETDEQKGMMIAAIKERYGVDELAGELSSNALPRLYKALALLPDNHTKLNAKLREITRSKMSDTSLYSKGVININGGESGPHSSGKEKYDDGAGKKMKFNKFDAHTLHEVGHSVDDACGFMDAHRSKPAYGGWAPSNSNDATNAAVRKFKAEWSAFGEQALAVAVGELLAGRTADKALELIKAAKKGYESVTRAVLLKDPAVVKADEIMEEVIDDRGAVLTPEASIDLDKKFNPSSIGAMSKLDDIMVAANFCMAMRSRYMRAADLADQYEASFAAAGDEKQFRKLCEKVAKWVRLVTDELWFASSGDVDAVAVDGKVYQRDKNTWWRYDLSARKQMVKDYQFRSPAEWFAECYAVEILHGLNSGHPLAGEVRKLDTTQKIVAG